MKSILIPSLIFLLIGFTFGWLVRGTSLGIDRIENRIITRPAPVRIPPPAPDITTTQPRPDPIPQDTAPRPIELPTPGNATPPPSATKADEAKWLRLIEVLGLDRDQAAAIEAAISESRPNPTDDLPPDLAYTEAGDALEGKLLAILNPQQTLALKELQRRSLENRNASRAGLVYSTELGDLDLSEKQRQQTIGILTDDASRQSSSITNSSRLYLSGSFLPIGVQTLGEDGILLQKKLREDQVSDTADFSGIADIHRAELVRKAALLEDILSPAQLELYRAKLSESLEIIDKISPPR